MPAADWQSRLRGFDRRFLARAGGVLVGLCLFYAFDWELAQRLSLGAFAAGLTAIGHDVGSVPSAQSLALMVDGQCFPLGPACTYLDLVLVLTPLVWRSRRTWAANLGRGAAMGVGVFLLNEGRVLGAIHGALVTGADWNRVHHVPDVLLHVTVITWVALAALREDWLAAMEEAPDLGARLPSA